MEVGGGGSGGGRDGERKVEVREGGMERKKVGVWDGGREGEIDR